MSIDLLTNPVVIKYDGISTRDAFGKALLRAGERYENLLAIGADTNKSMGFAPLTEAHGNMVVNVGIAEQNMALAGAGAAACGAKAVIATYAPFASMRMLEQVRTFIAYPGLDVKIISGLGGMSGAIEGVTHQGLEDVSIMRGIPNMVVAVPADAASTEAVSDAILDYAGPAYLRVGRTPVPKVFDESYTFQIGKANLIKPTGKQAAIICNGIAVHRVLEANKLLEQQGFDVRIIEMPCVKPIDRAAILEAARETGLLITVEENNIVGGLGGAVCEVVCEEAPTKVVRLGISDRFTESAPYEELLNQYGLGVNAIAQAVAAAIAKQTTR